jgi:hypothetical protein
MVVTESMYFVQHKNIIEIVWLYSLNPDISVYTEFIGYWDKT